MIEPEVDGLGGVHRREAFESRRCPGCAAMRYRQTQVLQDPASQATSTAPQLPPSLQRSPQVPQFSLVIAQVPPQQGTPSHWAPHPPQLLGSVARSTVPPSPQRVVLPLWQVPLLQRPRRGRTRGHTNRSCRDRSGRRTCYCRKGHSNKCTSSQRNGH